MYLIGDSTLPEESSALSDRRLTLVYFAANLYKMTLTDNQDTCEQVIIFITIIFSINRFVYTMSENRERCLLHILKAQRVIFTYPEAVTTDYLAFLLKKWLKRLFSYKNTCRLAFCQSAN